MTLKQTKKIYVLVWLTVGCLSSFGQPAVAVAIAAADNNPQLSERSMFWTLQHTLFAVGMMACVACLALLWVMLLRRKVAEQTAILQQSEGKFRSLVEQSLVGVYVLQDGRFAYANPRMADIYGYSVEEFTAPTFTTRQTVFEEDWPIVEEQIR